MVLIGKKKPVNEISDDKVETAVEFPLFDAVDRNRRRLPVIPQETLISMLHEIVNKEKHIEIYAADEEKGFGSYFGFIKRKVKKIKSEPSDKVKV
jgi:hypothetical protein